MDLPDRVLTAEYSWERLALEDSCSIQRSFDEGEDKDVLLLELRQYSPGSAARATLFSNKYGIRSDHGIARKKVNFVFVGSEAPYPEAGIPQYFRMIANSGKGLIFPVTLRDSVWHTGADGNEERLPEEYIEPGASSIPFVGTVEQIGVLDLFEESFTIDTGPMEGEFEFLAECTNQLLEGWGIDPEAHQNVSKHPRPGDVGKFARTVARDYPDEMLRDGYGGVLDVRLIVEADGSISDCFIAPPVMKEFAEAACDRIAAYGDFEPALDPSGQAIRDFFTTKIVYSIN